MGDLLELGEHRLADDRAADGVDLAVDQDTPVLSSLLAFCHQVPAEQLLVERAGHLGDENRVVVILVRLMLGRVVAVHRVAGLVGQREDVIEHVGLIVHQDVRLAVVRAGGECAALLALVRIAVAPAVVQARFRARRNIRCPAARATSTTTLTAWSQVCRVSSSLRIGT